MNQPLQPYKCKKHQPCPMVGMMIHPRRGDRSSLKTACSGFYNSIIALLNTEDRLLDLGANIGAFSRLAKNVGISEIVCVEANPDLEQVLTANMPYAKIIMKAVVGDDYIDLMARFNISESSSSLGSLTAPGSAWGIKRKVLVPVVSMRSLLCDYFPTVVKIDIEGGEYAALKNIDWSESVRLVYVEYHRDWCGIRNTDNLIEAIHLNFMAQGFDGHIKVTSDRDKMILYDRCGQVR